MRFAWGTLLESSAKAARQPASYDWKGTRYLWKPSTQTSHPGAFDVERMDTPASDLALVASLSHPDFLKAWTRLEVLAKLSGEPVLARLRRDALIVPPLDASYLHTESSGATYQLHSGVWAERQLVFTCGFRVT
jgi:hypothetical protein